MADSNMVTVDHANMEAIDQQAMTPPQMRLMRLPEVIARVGIKRSTIYQRMSEGRSPKARSLGPKSAVWVESEIDDWIRSVIG